MAAQMTLPNRTGNGIKSRLACMLAAALSCAIPGAAQQNGPSLKTIDNPSGGHVVYGVFDRESTMQGAMASMLRKVHNNFGVRPQIGQFFQSRDGHTVGTFFNLTPAKPGSKSITGMVVVTMPAGLKPAAAALFDDAGRFKTTQPQLFRKLSQAFANTGSTPSQSSGTSSTGSQRAVIDSPTHHASSAGAAQLNLVKAGDGSAAMGLPDGWKLTGSGSGMMQARGPKGEVILMGAMFQNNYDPRTQQGHSMLQYMSRGNTPFTACPLTSDLASSYLCVMQATFQRMHKTAPTMRVISSTPIPGPNPGANVVAEMNFGDERGPMKVRLQIGSNARPGAANWMMSLFEIAIPKDLADQERPTIDAITASYTQDAQVIRAQGNAASARIREEGKATQTRINEHEREVDQQKKDFEGHMAAIDQNGRDFDQKMDNIDRQSKSQQNYMMDKSVVGDNEIPAHETLDNPTADAYVKANPDRYQIIPQKDWIRGLDY